MNLTKFLKTGITTLILAIIAVLIIVTMGFNKGFDFTGGSIITVNCQNYTQTETKNKINHVVSSYDNAKIVAVQFGEVYDDKTVTVKIQFKDDAEATTDLIVEDLYTNFIYNSEDAVQSNFVTATSNAGGAYSINSIFYNALLGALIAIVAVAIYVGARLGIANAFALIAGAIIDIIAMISVVAIFRVEVSSYIGIAVLIMAVVSMLLNYIILSALTKNSYDESNKKATNKEIVFSTTKQNARPILVKATSIIVALLLIAIITPASISGIAFAVALGVALSVITVQYITPTLWSFAFVRKTKQPKQNKQIQVESEE